VCVCVCVFVCGSRTRSVMQAWAKARGVSSDQILMLSDGAGTFSDALGYLTWQGTCTLSSGGGGVVGGCSCDVI
jgi:peroxiredoxin